VECPPKEKHVWSDNNLKLKLLIHMKFMLKWL
jgi:hypothetical protein